MSIEALLSRGDGSDEAIDLRETGPVDIPRDELLWVDVVGADDAETDILRRGLRLTRQAANALVADLGEPRATVADGAVAVEVVSLDGDDQHATPMRILVGQNWILTRHDEPMRLLEEHRARITDQREVGLLSPVEFLVAILGWHVDSFFRAAERLEREVDVLDEAALRSERDLLQRLVSMRRRIARLRRVASVHRELFAELARPDFLPELDERESRALAELAERIERASGAIASTREMLIGTFDVHMTRTAQRTNDIMRVLTLASVILLPSVVLAGVMGMNFKIPLFDSPGNFFVVVGLMIAMAVVTLGVAAWRRWL